MDARTFGKMAAPMVRRLGNMMARGVVALADSARKMQQIQCRLLAGEVADLEHFESYGFTSRPHPGAEVVTMFFDGDRSHGVIIVAADRRYRLAALEYGEVALHDDQGQSVHLTRDGIVVNGGGLPITFTNTPKVRFETPQFEVTGEIEDRCDTNSRTVSDMREIYDTHTHPENDAGGPTDEPNQQMGGY